MINSQLITDFLKLYKIVSQENQQTKLGQRALESLAQLADQISTSEDLVNFRHILLYYYATLDSKPILRIIKAFNEIVTKDKYEFLKSLLIKEKRKEIHEQADLTELQQTIDPSSADDKPVRFSTIIQDAGFQQMSTSSLSELLQLYPVTERLHMLRVGLQEEEFLRLMHENRINEPLLPVLLNQNLLDAMATKDRRVIAQAFLSEMRHNPQRYSMDDRLDTLHLCLGEHYSTLLCDKTFRCQLLPFLSNPERLKVIIHHLMLSPPSKELTAIIEDVFQYIVPEYPGIEWEQYLQAVLSPFYPVLERLPIWRELRGAETQKRFQTAWENYVELSPADQMSTLDIFILDTLQRIQLDPENVQTKIQILKTIPPELLTASKQETFYVFCQTMLSLLMNEALIPAEDKEDVNFLLWRMLRSQEETAERLLFGETHLHGPLQQLLQWRNQQAFIDELSPQDNPPATHLREAFIQRCQLEGNRCNDLQLERVASLSQNATFEERVENFYVSEIAEAANVDSTLLERLNRHPNYYHRAMSLYWQGLNSTDKFRFLLHPIQQTTLLNACQHDVEVMRFFTSLLLENITPETRWSDQQQIAVFTFLIREALKGPLHDQVMEKIWICIDNHLMDVKSLDLNALVDLMRDSPEQCLKFIHEEMQASSKAFSSMRRAMEDFFEKIYDIEPHAGRRSDLTDIQIKGLLEQHGDEVYLFLLLKPELCNATVIQFVFNKARETRQYSLLGLMVDKIKDLDWLIQNDILQNNQDAAPREQDEHPNRQDEATFNDNELIADSSQEMDSESVHSSDDPIRQEMSNQARLALNEQLPLPILHAFMPYFTSEMNKTALFDKVFSHLQDLEILPQDEQQRDYQCAWDLLTSVVVTADERAAYFKEHPDHLTRLQHLLKWRYSTPTSVNMNLYQYLETPVLLPQAWTMNLFAHSLTLKKYVQQTLLIPNLQKLLKAMEIYAVLEKPTFERAQLTEIVSHNTGTGWGDTLSLRIVEAVENTMNTAAESAPLNSRYSNGFPH